MPSVAGKTVLMSRVPYSTYQQQRPTPQESSMVQKKAAVEAATAKAKSKMLVLVLQRDVLCLSVNKLSLCKGSVVHLGRKSCHKEYVIWYGCVVMLHYSTRYEIWSLSHKLTWTCCHLRRG